jgi:5-(carboxyamino)imidazole ribonucleotide mutase
MGSDSDWPVMAAAASALSELAIGYEVEVISAHRMPEETISYGRTARERGLSVIIAGAGGAAALPGMLAAVTDLPVIGVPVPLKVLDGLDSLLSIAQMPAGIPVATVAIGGARNAGLLAARILAAGSGPRAAALAGKLREAMADTKALALAKGVTPRALGRDFLEDLRQSLLRNDQYIPGLYNQDPADLARSAVLTATSHSTRERYDPHRGVPAGLQPLDETYCLIFRENPAPGLELYVHAGSAGPISGPAKLTARWVAMETVDVQDLVEEVSLEVPAGFEGWLPVPRGKDLPDPRAEADPQVAPGPRWGLQLLACPGVSLRRVDWADHGFSIAVHRPPYWSPTRNTTFLHRYAGAAQPPLADCGPANVINGVARPVSPTQYAWVSDPGQPLPQDITLTFPKPADIGRVQLVFDTDLCNPLFSFQAIPQVPQLVKDYDLLADGVPVLEVRDSNARFRRHDLALKNVKALTVRVLATYGDPSARIFEIRVYGRA